MKTVKEILVWAKKELKDSPSPDLDALIILGFVSKLSREKLLANLDKKIANKKLKEFEKLIGRRKKGEPIAYITGCKEFYGLDFLVTPDVLIPRPETETLVDTILDHIRQMVNSKQQMKKQLTIIPVANYQLPITLDIADIGTGSGCIAITLAKQLPRSNIFAFDASKKALDIAKKNAENILGHSGPVQNLKFIKNDLLAGVRQKFDIITANLPYLSETEYKKTAADIKYEPRSALIAGKTGLEIFQKFIPQLKFTTKPRSAIFLEIGTSSQAQKLSELIIKYFPLAKIKIKKDLAGLNRVLIVKT